MRAPKRMVMSLTEIKIENTSWELRIGRLGSRDPANFSIVDRLRWGSDPANDRPQRAMACPTATKGDGLSHCYKGRWPVSLPPVRNPSAFLPRWPEESVPT